MFIRSVFNSWKMFLDRLFESEHAQTLFARSIKNNVRNRVRELLLAELMMFVRSIFVTWKFATPFHPRWISKHGMVEAEGEIVIDAGQGLLSMIAPNHLKKFFIPRDRSTPEPPSTRRGRGARQ